MKVLLISANSEQINMPVLPLGLAYVATAADSQGHKVKMINLMMQTDTQKALHEAIDEFNPEIIGISVRNIDDRKMESPRFLLETVKEVVTSCRKYSDATIVLGGAGYSIFPQATLDFLDADIGIQGEGESAFLALLNGLHEKKALSDIPGLYLPGQKSQKEPRHGFVDKKRTSPLDEQSDRRTAHSVQERLVGEILQIERRATWILTSVERQPS